LPLEDCSLLITGATGQTARHFFDRLRKEKYAHKVKCLVRNNSKIDNINSKGLNIELVVCDFNDINSLKTALYGIKTVLHIAHITLSEKLLQAGDEVGVNWFICVHTTGRYSKFRTASANYVRIENILLNKYSNLTILRPTMIYGSKSDQSMWKLIDFLYRNSFFPIFGSGDNMLQPVNAIDLGNAYFEVLKHKNNAIGKEYNLSGRDHISYNSLLKEITKALKKRNFLSASMKPES